MQPLVSVVCACFNIEKYLDESLASIYGQNYQSFEVIVVDDGSTDGSYGRLVHLQKKYGFQLYSQKNQGVSSALNRGMAYAKGEYVMIPDLDDTVLPDALSQRVSYLEEHPEVGAVGGFNICTDAQGKEISRDSFKEGEIEKWTFDEVLENTVVLLSLTVLYRMESLKVAGFFDSLIKVQDFQMTMRIAAQGYEIHRLPSYMGVYRQHGFGLSTKYKHNYEADMKTIESYRSHPAYKSARLKILNKALKKAVVQDRKDAWRLFRSVPIWEWDRLTFKRFSRFVRHLGR
ncbi:MULTISPECIES: glycosyltransferase family 2 protein [Pseudomonas aeruginosa group]|uniref:glycosyltransferase family 2 protein n=1 Tax=Pseudomonas aeruginosa group TaxID=136841 RepID=UPI0008FB17D5|nr:glycosyltransferase family 2 protein [Pseudomonas aeruginosa]OPE34758.1 glycosyl transferase [Pseudomonas aeruginosa]RPV15484.1 glycosyltransferase family 2 protein [Pseudomonas aeruginosa]